MNVAFLAAVLRERARISSHDRWSRAEVLANQGKRLAPLTELPTVTKATLMERFDDLVTDREVRLAEVERYLDTASATDRFRHRYRVAATGGTTGRRGVLLADPHEWTTVLASYSRAYVWAGVAAGLTNRLRMAVISSRNPTHQSSIVGATVASRFIPTLRLDAVQPIDEIVNALNEFKPDSLVGYASILRTLAEEQAAGRLAVRPQAIMSASEVLTDDARTRIHEAFGVAPTNVYAATETAGIASECRAGHLHRYEDLVVAEIVDEDNQPIPDGETGAKLLVSVLFSRTQPLIRYEISDRVAAVADLPDDLPYAALGRIEGRQEEVLQLGGMSIHPNLFHGALERVAVAGWQVIDEGDRLRVLLVQVDSATAASARGSVEEALSRRGVVGVPVTIEAVDAIPRTALGKAPLIRRAPAAIVPAA